MSQIAMIASPGTIAPDVETLTGDLGGPIGPDAAFNIDILGDSFITTTGTPNTITISLNHTLTEQGQTIGAVDTDLTSVNLGLIPTTYTIEAKVVGYESTGASSAGYNLICIAQTVGGVASIIGVQDKYNSESAPLALCDANFVAVGNAIVVRISGTAGLTVNWRATTTYTRTM